MRNIFFIFIGSIVFVSCKQESKDLSMSVYRDTLQIKESSFNSKCRVKPIVNTVYFQGYENLENKITLIEIDSSKEVFSVHPRIDFSEEGAGRFVQFDIYKIDSIFIVTENNVFIINAAGSVIYKKDLTEPVTDDNGNTYRLWDNDNLFPLEYNPGKGELLIHAICNCSFFDKRYMDGKVQAGLNIKDGGIKFYDYGFPDSYKLNSFGQAVFPFKTVNGILDIISFPCDDTLYIFNRKTEQMQKMPARSKYQKSNFIPFDTTSSGDMERMREYLTVIPMYPRILYDKYRNRYYRFFQKEQSLKDDKGEYAELFDKDLIVMVLDSNFKIIHEENLGKTYFGYYSFVSSKGLYILKYDKTEQNSDKEYSIFSVFNWN